LAKQQPKKQFGFDLTPTQGRYVFSNTVVNLIYSNTGEGKSLASIIAMLYHAQRNAKPIRCAVVRDTHENIKLSTARSIQDALPPELYRFKNDYKELTIFSDPQIKVDLFGIDDPASLSKLQGPEYALIWLEEPAPMSDRANAGLSEEVFNAALVRCARQKDTVPRLQISMNPADEDHWTYKRFFEEPDIDPDNPLITKAVFKIPYGENPYVTEVSRQAVKSAYKGDMAAYKRYVKGEFSPVYKGTRVTPKYDPEIHLSKTPLVPAQGLEGFRAWDGWHNPALLLGQITHAGRLVFIDTIRIKNSDIRTLIKTKAIPLLNSLRWKGKCKSWRDIGDFSMKTPDQSNQQESAARVIEDAFGTFFEAGPSKWTHMKRGIDYVFENNILGKSAFIINKAERILHKGLIGDWHYKTDNSGNIMKDTPEKNSSSHPCDAWANAVNVLLPARSAKINRSWLIKMQRKARQRANSYGVAIHG
jgi:hypothetical protein